MSPRLTDAEVLQILHLHLAEGVNAATIARWKCLSINTVNAILWGKTHKRITQGRNVSQADARRKERVEIIQRVYAETGSKSAAAKAAGVSWQAVDYHLKKEKAA